jgi:hypothetical protein
MVVSDAPDWRIGKFQLGRYQYALEQLDSLGPDKTWAKTLLYKAIYSLYQSCVDAGVKKEADLIRQGRISKN